MKAYLIYMTTGDNDEARRIGKHLVQSHLAACVNIIDRMNSIYVWDGELQEDNEVVMIAKTVETKVPDVIAAVKEMHSYECPCVLALPIADGNPDFLSWIVAQAGVEL